MIEYNLVAPPTSNLYGYFIEEMNNAQFASYAEVTSLAGVTQGTLQNEGSGWLKFIVDDKVLIVAKRYIRLSTSWTHLDSLGCVFGTKEIEIQGKRYKVRLLKGADENPTSAKSGSRYPLGTHNSEWNKLFLPIVNDDLDIPNLNTNAPYSQGELLLNGGPYTWCQETHTENVSYRVAMGKFGTTHFVRNTASANTTYYGWRPCMELIS